MLAVVDAAGSTDEIAKRIGDPNTAEADLESFIIGTLGERLNAHCRNLVQLLIRNGRLTLMPQMRELYEALRREHEGTVEAKIVSARPIADQQLQLLLGALESKYGRRITAQVEIDPELIGGARILVGDKVIDA